MLDKLLAFVEKNPKKAAIIGALISIPLFIIQSINTYHRTPVQEQNLSEGDEPLDQPSQETFDKAKCKVYTVGILAGAIVYQFKTTDNALAYVMVADRDEVIRIFEKNNLHLWRTRQDFQNTEYTGLIQVLPPEGIHELNEILSMYPYAAMGTEAIAKSAQPTMFNSDRCDVE
ncbi:hypothetical protein [Nostoc sp. FACHB-110]|uniref:hypothetical protein n=1 Tax=Nostoc sp. FACHB-110 TaxID=2692834 RepID=UPI0016862BD8|nr:hypothetical protein [Nostoc sp. FACHB-110]MBD2435451.1 hypothetical protein [Nostoc sp. FACHB-110]